jgi:hypothetical protein
MDLRAIAERIDGPTARAFVGAARHMIDAMLIEAGRVQQTRTPGTVDYNTAEISRTTPAGGWLSDVELRGATQRLSESMAAERWSDGVLFAFKALALMGAI